MEKINNVYFVTRGCGSDYTIAGVYTDRKLAEAHLSAMEEFGSDFAHDATIETHFIMTEVPREELCAPWCVGVEQGTGKIVEIYRIPEDEVVEDYETSLFLISEDTGKRYKTKVFCTCVSGTMTREDAKIAALDAWKAQNA